MPSPYAARPSRPFPTEQEGLTDVNVYYKWAADQQMYPIILLANGALETTSGFTIGITRQNPGETPQQNKIRDLKSIAENNVRVYESNPGSIPNTPVSISYERSKEFLQELKQIETDKMYVAPSGDPSRRLAFGEADYADGKTSVQGGRKRRKTSKRKHRKSKTAKRRARR